MGRVVTMDEAVRYVDDGAVLGIGGVLLQRKPIAFLDALVVRGVGGLRLHSFLASLDAELLAAHAALAEVHAGYVGFEQLGFAPAYGAAVEAGAVDVHEYTEFLFVAGLRARLAGLPFMPAKGGLGSDVLTELGHETITCPYTGTELVAVPAMHIDVAVLHAEAADRHGTVLGPARKDFLFDLDANLARAADEVVVTVERILDDDEVRRLSDRTLLYPFEVTAVVEVPRGAAPTALPGVYEPDLAALRTYLGDVAAAPDDAASAMRRLTGAAVSA